NTYLENTDMAVEASYQSLGVFEKAGSVSGVINQCMQLALLRQRVRDGRDALPFLISAQTRYARPTVDRLQGLAILDVAADVCVALHLDQAAADFQSESLRGHERIDKPRELCRVLSHFGSMLTHLKRFGEAETYLRRALEIAGHIENEEQSRDSI